MKKKMNCIILSLLILTASCAQDENAKLCDIKSCDDEVTVDELENVRAKVINFQNSGLFILTLDSISLQNPGYVVGSNNILIPCEALNKSLAKDESYVIVSGYKKNCCNLLTLSQLRVSFGCKFEITSIIPLAESE